MDGYIVGSMISANSITGEQIQANSIKTANLELSVQKKIQDATNEETVKALIKADLDGFESTLSKEFVTVENATTQIQQATEVAVKEATQNIIDNAISESMGAVDGQLNDKLNQYTGNTLLPAINEKAEEVLQNAENYVITQLENYTTKQELSSSISQTREQIELSVSEKYTTKTESATIITEAIDGITVGAINRVFGTGENKSFKFNGGANETWLTYKFSNDISDKEVFVSFKYTLTGTAQNGSQIEFAPSYLKKTNNQTVYRPKHIFFTSSRLQDVNIADTVSFTTKDFQDISPSSTSYIRFVGNGFTGTLSISEVQIKPGNSKTTWSPAPEDTISDINDAKNEAINAANGTLIATISNYYTKSETDSKISVAKDEINLGVSSTYETKANVETMVTSTLNSAKSYSDTKKTEAINAANNTLTTTIANYYTKTETDSNINVAKNAITTSVSNLRSEVMSATYTNLLENSDFLILDNDFPRGYSRYTIDSNTSVSMSGWSLDGGKAVRITSAGQTDNVWIAMFSPFVKAYKGETFTASVFITTNDYTAIDNQVAVEIEWYSDSGRIGTSAHFFTKTYNGWERQSVTGTAPDGTTKARMRVHVVKNGTIYVTKMMLQTGGILTNWVKGGNIDSVTERLSYAEQKITDESITNTVKKNFYTKEETNNAITSKGYATQSQLQQTANNITSTVSQNYYTKQETENTINNKNFATKSEVQQTAENIEFKFTQSGGYNLIRNGGFENGTNYWSRNGNFTDDKDFWLPYGNGTSWVIWADAWSGFYQFFNCRVGQTYSWSMDVYVEHGYFRAGVEDISEEWYRADNGWVKMKGTFTATRESHAFILYAAENQTAAHFDNIMVCEGSIPSAYTPHPSEIYDGITTIDKDGIKVTSSIMNGYTHMTNRGFYINKDDSNIFKVDGDGLSLRGCGANSGRYIKIENEDYTVWNNNINCLRFGYKNWNGWDGVPEFLMGYKGFRYSETANTGEDASYFGMQTWGRGVKNNNNYAYHDIYYRSDKFGDQSHLRFSEDGLSQLRSLKKIELKAGSDSYIVADKDSGLSFPQGVNTFGINDTIWLKNSNFGITWGKYTGKEEYNLRPTTTAPVDLGHESYRYRTIYATNGSINTSDISLKENINPIVSKADTPMLLIDDVEVALSSEDYYEFVKILPMYTYDYKSKDDEENRALHNVGFIAQDVADTPVGNEFIFKGEDGVYQYNMQGYVGVLAVALQNAIKEIETLKEEIRQLKTTF